MSMFQKGESCRISKQTQIRWDVINQVSFERLSWLVCWLQREVEIRARGGAGQLPRRAGIIARFGLCQLAWKEVDEHGIVISSAMKKFNTLERGNQYAKSVTLDSIPFVCVPLKQLLIDRHSTVRAGKVSHLDVPLSASTGSMDNLTH
jgi:hypothetical protein